MAENVEYEVPAWNKIYEMLLSLSQKIQRQPYKPDLIVGIGRGGLVPARILADLLETPELGFIQIEFYTDINQTRAEPKLTQTLNAQIANKKTLIVDDIADSGKSLVLAKTHLQNQGATQTKTTTLYQKPHSASTPDFYEKQTTKWVVFPWDTKETLRKIILKQQGKEAVNQEVAKLVKAGLPKQLAEKLLKDML